MSSHDITDVTQESIEPARTRAPFPIGSRHRSLLFRGLIGLAAVGAVGAGYVIYCVITIRHNGGLVVEPTPRAPGRIQ